MSNIINLSSLSIEIPDGRIGLSLSGGADSALLAYILLKHATGPIHIFTTVDKGVNQKSSYYAPLVIKKCMDLTGNYRVRHHINLIEKYDREKFLKNLRFQFKFRKLTTMFMGTTELPPDDVLNTFSTKLPDEIYDRRNPSLEKDIYWKNFYNPLMNHNKKEIRTLYEELGIIEDVFPLTNSCTDGTDKLDHCGVCWWCQERKWAFG